MKVAQVIAAALSLFFGFSSSEAIVGDVPFGESIVAVDRPERGHAEEVDDGGWPESLPRRSPVRYDGPALGQRDRRPPA